MPHRTLLWNKIQMKMKRNRKYKTVTLIEESVQDSQVKGRLSHRVLVAKLVIIKPQRHTYVTVMKSCYGTMEIKQHQEIYDKHSTLDMHGIMDVQTNVYGSFVKIWESELPNREETNSGVGDT